MGLYFLTPGAVLRPSEVLYDRQGSCFAEAPDAGVDWGAVLGEAGRLHLSGVARDRAQGRRRGAARGRGRQPVGRAGVVRRQLPRQAVGAVGRRWAGHSAGAVLGGRTTAFADDRDMALVLKRDFPEPDARLRRRHRR